MNIQDVLLSPIVTEKSTALKEQNYYTFKVLKSANKISIKKAVETVYGVNVIECKVLRTKPKTKMLRTKKGFGKTTTYKKAMVRLKKGENISELDV